MTVTPFLRLPLLGTLLGLHIASQAAPAAPVVVRFDTTPVAGQHQRQQLDMQATMKMRVEAGPEATEEQRAKAAQAAQRVAQTGDVKMNVQITHTTRVGQPQADGWLPMSFVASDRKTAVEVGGKAVPMPPNATGDMTITARFNPKDFAFQVQDVEGGAPGAKELMTTQGQAMVNDAFNLHRALAARSLKVGDSVDVPITMQLPMPLPGGAGALQGQVQYTLVRVERGVAYFDLNMTMNVKIESVLPPSAAASGASAPAAPATTSPLRLTLDGTGKGTSALRLADRLPLATDLTMDMKMAMDGPDNARMLMDMTMVTRAKGETLGIRQAPAKKKS